MTALLRGGADAADYTVWRITLGTADLRADDNDDEVIDEGDYAIWKSLFGTTYASDSGSFSTVPESAGAALPLMGAILAGVRRRPRAGRTLVAAS